MPGRKLARIKVLMALVAARPSRLRSRRRGVRAFSTLEVLAALVVSMILASIGLAAMQLYQTELPLSGSANRLAYAFSTARTMAISRNSTFAVVIDRDFNNFWINETDAMGGTIAAKVVSPEVLDPRVTISEIQPPMLNVAQVYLMFYPDGHSDDAAVYLKLRARLASLNTGDVTTVRLYGPTGLSRVFERQQVVVP